MIRRLRPFAWLIAFAPACLDFTGPRLREMTLSDCIGWPWVAYQTDDGPWTWLGSHKSSYSIRVGSRVTIAYGRFQDLARPTAAMWVEYLHRDDLDPQDCSPPPESWPGGQIGGTVAGLSGAQWAGIIYRNQTADVRAGANTWEMIAQPVPATLLAMRFDSSYMYPNPDRFIVRRDRSYLPGTPVPLLDFGSEEAFASRVNTVSFTSPPASVGSSVIIGGVGNGVAASRAMPSTDGVMPRTATIYSFPPERQSPGDLHQMAIRTFVETSVESYAHEITHFFRTASDHTMSMPPVLATPAFTTVATTPYHRFRVQLPLQPEFGEAVWMSVMQSPPTHHFEVYLRFSRRYFGFPASGSGASAPAMAAAWDVTFPDFTGLPGFSAAAMPRAGALGWNATASSVGEHFRWTDARDGDIVRQASRRGTSP